jgi:hypothetical protein
MNYTKPEITSLASASFAIHGTTSKQSGSKDSADVQFVVTIAAYEADE